MIKTVQQTVGTTDGNMQKAEIGQRVKPSQGQHINQALRTEKHGQVGKPFIWQSLMGKEGCVRGTVKQANPIDTPMGPATPPGYGGGPEEIPFGPGAWLDDMQRFSPDQVLRSPQREWDQAMSNEAGGMIPNLGENYKTPTASPAKSMLEQAQGLFGQAGEQAGNWLGQYGPQTNYWPAWAAGGAGLGGLAAYLMSRRNQPEEEEDPRLQKLFARRPDLRGKL